MANYHHLKLDNQAAVLGAMSRRRPFHTCGASVLAIIHIACTKAQELNGPFGTLAKRITKSMSAAALPLLYVVQYQWLAILSFTDDGILTFEKLVETVLPPSTLLFDKIDKLVYKAEVMPGRFDEALNRFPIIMDRVPFLDWALMQIIWWLNFLISILTHWGGNNVEEKDIMIDMNSKARSNVTESAGNANCPNQELPSAFCPPREKNLEVGEAESNAELPAVAKSPNKEKLLLVLDSMENEAKTDNPKYTTESSTSNQSGNLIPAPLVEVYQEKSKSVDHDQLPSIAAPPGNPSQDRSKTVNHVELPSIATPPSESSQDKSTSVDHTELPSIATPQSKSSRDKSTSVDHTELPSIATPRSKSSQDSVDHAELPSIAKKKEPPKDKTNEKLGKRTKADNAQEGSRQRKISEEKVGREKEKDTQKSIKEMNQKDPVLELFESRWLL